ncbi:MAG: bifunctional heptose 7-phosphate kinase/heptose 1-phosphate adenyltransferase [Planctomycetes bacterium]|nr:bifunctional heptose 7-phosphate kinase/heptose 1-phosphate adenyltransferase [Planctomycetota bacterium]
MQTWEAFNRVRALVIGDCMLDRYVSGHVKRLSPEAPVPVVLMQGQRHCPGGAANVAASLAALGARASLVGVVGNDPEADLLRDTLVGHGPIDAHLHVCHDSPTVCKTRVLADAWHQLVRLDQDGVREALELSAIEALGEMVGRVSQHDIVLLADYEKGTLPREVLRAVIDQCREQGILCLVDPKKRDFSLYGGATFITPNLAELERAVGRPLAGETEIVEAARDLCRQFFFDYVLVTRAAEGMTLVSRQEVHHFAAHVRPVADVSGAGDTVVATLAAALAAGWEIATACRLATVAAGIAVSRPGTYIVRGAELETAWSGRSLKVLDREAARHRVRDARRAGQRVVFTNGCFDILHAGHLACLERARQHGDLLVVGLNSDDSVTRNKGPGRPVLLVEHRAALLAGLACVDIVVVFNELTPESLIRQLEPDCLVKGADYHAGEIVGAEFVKSRGGQVVTVPLMPGLSTTHILQLREAADE